MRHDRRIASEEAASAGAPAHKESWSAHARGWLGNPLVVTCISAVLVYLIIPQVTRKWQDHAQVLDIQTGLVGDMSESTSDTIMTSRLIGARLSGPSTQQAFNDTVKSWAIRSAVIGSKLEAYFPHTGIGAKWREYSEVVADYVQLAATLNASRAGRVAAIRAYPDLPRITAGRRIDWRVLATQAEGQAFQDDYELLGRVLLARRDELVQRVLAAHPSGFG
jgi:hypothetical protein